MRESSQRLTVLRHSLIPNHIETSRYRRSISRPANSSSRWPTCDVNHWIHNNNHKQICITCQHATGSHRDVWDGSGDISGRDEDTPSQMPPIPEQNCVVSRPLFRAMSRLSGQARNRSGLFLELFSRIEASSIWRSS
jgi:hypothetical protein